MENTFLSEFLQQASLKTSFRLHPDANIHSLTLITNMCAFLSKDDSFQHNILICYLSVAANKCEKDSEKSLFY